MAAPTFEELANQLSKGLDLCIRARKLDAQDRTNIMVETFPGIDIEKAGPKLTESFPAQPYMTRSATIPVWIQQQYDEDLLKWESETRAMLSCLPLYDFANPTPKEV